MGKVVIPGFRKIELSGGGEGGTSNYNDLENKPSINNVPLVGNLNTANLKLTDATLTEEGVPAEAKTVGTKLEEQSTSLTALSNQLGNHIVKSDVPENAVFTDTVYDDTEVKESIEELNSNLDTLEFGEVAGGKNLFNNAQELSVGLYISSGELNSSYHHKVVKVKPNTQYTVSSSEAFSTGYYLTYMNGNQFIDSKANLAVDGYYYTITTPDNCDNIWIYNYNNQNLQIEEGTTATSYEPYIPSVKMLADKVNQQNESLSDYGLDNLSNVWIQGRINTGSHVDSNIGIYSNSYPCSNGDLVTIKKESVAEIGIAWFYGSTFLSYEYAMTREEFKKNAPTNANSFRVQILNNDGITLSTAGHIGVYVNNAIDEIKNDLDKLSSLPIGSIIQIEAAKDNIETTTQKYGWQYLGTSKIECEDGAVMLLVTNVYRKNN